MSNCIGAPKQQLSGKHFSSKLLYPKQQAHAFLSAYLLVALEIAEPQMRVVPTAKWLTAGCTEAAFGRRRAHAISQRGNEAACFG